MRLADELVFSCRSQQADFLAAAGARAAVREPAAPHYWLFIECSCTRREPLAAWLQVISALQHK